MVGEQSDESLSDGTSGTEDSDGEVGHGRKG